MCNIECTLGSNTPLLVTEIDFQALHRNKAFARPPQIYKDRDGDRGSVNKISRGCFSIFHLGWDRDFLFL